MKKYLITDNVKNFETGQGVTTIEADYISTEPYHANSDDMLANDWYIVKD